MNNATPTNRLISFAEAATMVGFRSRTSLYATIKSDPSFPRPIYRGRNLFFLESELLAYLSQLVARRNMEPQDEQAAASKLAAQRMLAAKASKREAHRQRRMAAKAS